MPGTATATPRHVPRLRRARAEQISARFRTRQTKDATDKHGEQSFQKVVSMFVVTRRTHEYLFLGNMYAENKSKAQPTVHPIQRQYIRDILRGQTCTVVLRSMYWYLFTCSFFLSALRGCCVAYMVPLQYRALFHSTVKRKQRQQRGRDDQGHPPILTSDGGPGLQSTVSFLSRLPPKHSRRHTVRDT